MLELGGIGIRTESLSDTSTHVYDCSIETPPMLEVRDGRRRSATIAWANATP